MLTSLEPWMSHEGSTARWGSTAIARDTAVDPQSTAVLQIAAGTADVFHGNSGREPGGSWSHEIELHVVMKAGQFDVCLVCFRKLDI